MLKRVLVGTDFSPASEAVLACLGNIVEHAGLEEVVLAHVVYVANTPGLEEMLKQDAAPRLEAQAARLRDMGLQVATVMEVGVPPVELADLAEKHDVSATVVGSHGRGAIARVLLGSVSSGLLYHTTRPVLIIQLRLCETPEGVSCELACHDLFARLLVPTDFSDAAERAFGYLRGLLAEARAPVTLLHVQDAVRLAHLTDRLTEFDRIDVGRLQRMQADLEGQGVGDVTVELRHGSPVREIVQAASERAHSLIVMSTQGRGALAEVMLGSVAAQVARLAPVPVLFVPLRP
ncbi:MAG: universal stress protein [Candidatus Zipacnadales bacterium]